MPYFHIPEYKERKISSKIFHFLRSIVSKPIGVDVDLLLNSFNGFVRVLQVTSTNKTHLNDITEILLKVMLNTIKRIPKKIHSINKDNTIKYIHVKMLVWQGNYALFSYP
jgi:hypothetical protein